MSQAMEKRQIQARLIENGSNFRQFAISHGYEPRTVTQVVQRWAGQDSLPRGRLSFSILKDISRLIGKEVLPGILVDPIADLWLTIKSNSVAATSFRGYKNKAEVHVRPRWGEIQIDQIDHLDLQEWIQGPLSKRLKNKTIRDIISNVRQVFRLYRTRKKVAHDPTEGLFVRLPDPEAPDPFTRAEMKQILETPTNRTQELLMVQFMIWAGPRVSETIALAWEDVDLKQGMVTFRRSKVRGAYRVTKTRRSTRKVRLLEPAWDALRKLDAINQLKTVDTVDVVERDNKTVRKHKLHFVFLNTKSGLPHVSDFVVRDRFFKAHLKAAGVRYRGPGQCRHTYASQLLTTGVASVDWIAEQMGHTIANMILQHYGMWINEDGPDVIGILQHALGIQPPNGDYIP